MATTALYYYVPNHDHHHIDAFFATSPVGYADDGTAFAASFTNWAIKMAQKSLDKLKPTEVVIRNALRRAYPVTDVFEFVEILRLFGKEFRYNKKFHGGTIKDTQSEKQLEKGRAQLFGCLYTKDEKVALAAAHPDSYPLRAPDWAAKQWEQQAGSGGLAVRTRAGEDSETAQVMEGLEMSGDKVGDDVEMK
ncbi:hypothetical protein LTR56_024945 [Elasticomyces elasticus]|nr:hypothetical protein LTR56_024945 [Elasticomyces elasticus]KAK3668704.1 hypothetical protein LTR22_000593 [Elasticomyces elasticus]KAK4905141.1 hypothetical protein LTR49_025526 [Elasticomyces elasticus]KAK5762028.1 hypothetical protein LTS12_007902 [Elasticomyces elasticus]